jgi:hypothetical protein
VRALAWLQGPIRAASPPPRNRPLTEDFPDQVPERIEQVAQATGPIEPTPEIGQTTADTSTRRETVPTL